MVPVYCPSFSLIFPVSPFIVHRFVLHIFLVVPYGSHRRYDLLFLDVICKEKKWRTQFKHRPFSPRRDTTDDPIIAPLTQCLDCITTNRRRLTVLRMVPRRLDPNSANTIAHQWTRAGHPPIYEGYPVSTDQNSPYGHSHMQHSGLSQELGTFRGQQTYQSVRIYLL